MSLTPSESMAGSDTSSDLQLIAGPVLGIVLAVLAMVVLALA